jgi:hypothetical protein
MGVLPKDVSDIIETKRDCTPFLLDANVLVTEILGAAGLTQSRLDLITKYVAAHFVCLAEENGGLLSEKSGSSENRYMGVPTTYKSVTRGLNITRYGQQALAMDTSGLLASATANSGVKARFGLIPDYSHIKDNGWPPP